MSAFFGDCTTQGLRWIAETDPALWERIERREPNAYLVMLYWDSEMFGRNGAKRKELEGEEQNKDYRAIVMDMLFTNPDKYYIAKDTRKFLPQWRNMMIQRYDILDKHQWRMAHDALVFGDPKGRTLRAMISKTLIRYSTRIDKEAKKK